MNPPKIVVADTPNRGRMWYLVDANLDFIAEVKLFLDWKAATRHAPATIKAYCSRLLWFYRFLWQHDLCVLEATPASLTEFVIWLCNPYRDIAAVSPIHQASPLTASSVNLILQVVGAFYDFPVRRGKISESPVRYVDIPRGKWLTERDLLAHARRGRAVVHRMELRLKEPRQLPLTVSEQDFQTFIDSIHMGQDPNSDPPGFRDRLLCLMLKEGGFRLGELLGMRMEDLEFGKQGVHVRFRLDNENGARAKAGYGRNRFVHLPTDILGLLDIYLTEVWIEASPTTSHLWIVLRKDAKSREGCSTYGAALTVAAVEKMCQYYSKRSGIMLHPHALRHTHATALVRSYLQERLGHASVVTTMQTYTHLTNEDRKWAYDRYQERRAERAQPRTGR